MRFWSSSIGDDDDDDDDNDDDADDRRTCCRSDPAGRARSSPRRDLAMMWRMNISTLHNDG